MKFRLFILFVIFISIFIFGSYSNSAEYMESALHGYQINEPKVPMHYAMYDLMIGPGIPITYKSQADPDAEYVVVMGFVENWWIESGKRMMEAKAEGASPQIIDLASSPGKNSPSGIVFYSRDDDKNGWLDISVQTLKSVDDHNSIMNALWVFDKRIWDNNSLSVEKVFTGQFDNIALFFVDCGKPGSERIDLTMNDEIDRMKSAIREISKLSGSDDSIKNLIADKLPEIQSGFDSVDVLAENNKVYELSTAIKSFRPDFDEFFNILEGYLIKKYKPAFVKPIETRMSSPWGAVIKVRHENKLKLNFELYPKPDSMDYHWHSYQSRREPLKWIDIDIQNPNINELSNQLRLPYDLALKSVDYDPFNTSYAYQSSSVDIQVLNTSAVMIYPKNTSIEIDLSRNQLEFNNDMLMGKIDARGSNIYYGFIFKNASSRLGETKKIKCKGMAFIWADSLDGLISVAKKVRRWEKIKKDSISWANSQSNDANLDAPYKKSHLFELNQRALASMQFISGPMLAALDGGYIFTWVRDTTNGAVFAAQAGETQMLEKWAPYLLSNYSVVELNGKKYYSFFTFPGKNKDEYFKKEQDGQFYAIFTAYTYWKLTGDNSKLAQWYPILRSCMEYQRLEYFDPKLGLYWETSVNEASLKSAPEWESGERFPSLLVDGDWPLYNLGIYINNLMYASHLMLAEISKEIGANSDCELNLRFADELAQAVDKNLWDESKGYYKLGLAQMDTGELKSLNWNFHDSFFDYIWAYTMFPMMPDPRKSLISLDAILHQRDGEFPGKDHRMYFAPGFAHASYTYSNAGQYEKAEICLNRLLAPVNNIYWNNEMNALYAMKGAIHENMVSPGGHRPEIFCIGPALHAFAAQSASINYNGITLVPSRYISGINSLRYRDMIFNVDTCLKNYANGINVNGCEIYHTLRIPSSILASGKYKIKFIDSKEINLPLLEHTDFELTDIYDKQDYVSYEINGYGKGVLRFKGIILKDEINVRDAGNKPINFDIWIADGGTRIDFNANGRYVIDVLK